MKTKDKTLYFAYGSNLDLSGMDFRCPDAELVGAATLDGWRLTFRGVADIERAEGRRVVGGLWLCTPKCVQSLDRYEGAPSFYSQRKVTVTDHNGAEVEAMTYVMTRRHRGRLGLPSTSYYGSIERGFDAFGLPQAELKRALAETSEAHSLAGVETYHAVGPKRLMADTQPFQRSSGERRRQARAERARKAEEAPLRRTAGMSPASVRLMELERARERRLEAKAERDAQLQREVGA